MSYRYPPEGDKGTGKFLKPLVPLSQNLGVNRPINVMLEGLNCFPNGHVEQDAVIFIGPEVRCVALGGLQPPDKAWTTVSKCIQFVQPSHEPCHERIIERRF